MKYIYCIGNFDGVHRGHQKLIKKTLDLAQDLYIPAAITFEPNPDIYFNKGKQVLSTIEQKEEYLYQYGIQEVVVLPFDSAIAKMSPNDFINFILNQLDANTILYGQDFRFGDHGAGNHQVFLESEKRKFEVLQIEDLKEENQERKISSTTIIQLIKDGQMAKAVSLLGHSYYYCGEKNIAPKFGDYKIEEQEGPYHFKGQNKNVHFISEL